MPILQDAMQNAQAGAPAPVAAAATSPQNMDQMAAAPGGAPAPGGDLPPPNPEITSPLVKAHSDELAAMVRALTANTHGIPTLAIVLPVVSDSWISKANPMNLMRNQYRLYFLCSHTHQIAPCGPKGKGYKITMTKQWVLDAAPMLRVGLVSCCWQAVSPCLYWTCATLSQTRRCTPSTWTPRCNSCPIRPTTRPATPSW